MTGPRKALAILIPLLLAGGLIALGVKGGPEEPRALPPETPTPTLSQSPTPIEPTETAAESPTPEPTETASAEPEPSRVPNLPQTGGGDPLGGIALGLGGLAAAAVIGRSLRRSAR